MPVDDPYGQYKFTEQISQSADVDPAAHVYPAGHSVH